MEHLITGFWRIWSKTINKNEVAPEERALTNDVYHYDVKRPGI